jgi:hypothetical protein
MHWHHSAAPLLLLLSLQVLQVAVRAAAEPAHPFDLVAAWLAALGWVADSRWRRLPSGPHQAALAEWLECLELRVVALSLAQPADFAPDSPGMHACLCVPSRLCPSALRCAWRRTAPHANGHSCSPAAATLLALLPATTLLLLRWLQAAAQTAC